MLFHTGIIFKNSFGFFLAYGQIKMHKSCTSQSAKLNNLCCPFQIQILKSIRILPKTEPQFVLCTDAVVRSQLQSRNSCCLRERKPQASFITSPTTQLQLSTQKLSQLSFSISKFMAILIHFGVHVKSVKKEKVQEEDDDLLFFARTSNIRAPLEDLSRTQHITAKNLYYMYIVMDSSL